MDDVCLDWLVCISDMLLAGLFAILKNWLALGGAVFKLSKHENIQKINTIYLLNVLIN